MLQAGCCRHTGALPPLRGHASADRRSYDCARVDQYDRPLEGLTCSPEACGQQPVWTSGHPDGGLTRTGGVRAGTSAATVGAGTPKEAVVASPAD